MKKTITLAMTIAALAVASPVLAKSKGGPKFDFSTIDADGNGEITQAEVTAFEASQFASTDANNDGQLSSEEILAKLSAMRDGELSERAEKRVSRMISHLDENDDGTISLEEQQASERLTKMFERIDRDDSGTISQEEADMAKEKRGGKRGGKKDRNKNSRS